jgi:hypothetical protein
MKCPMTLVKLSELGHVLHETVLYSSEMVGGGGG